MHTTFRCGRAAVYDNHITRLSIDEVRRRTGATYVLGGWVFDNDPHSPTYLQPHNWLRVNGNTVSKDGYHEWRFCAQPTGAPVLSTDTTAPYILTGVPVLVNGEKVYRKLTPDVARKAARQAVCWMPDGKIMLYATQRTMSREDLQADLTKLHAASALMLDGGGSVQARGPGLGIGGGRTLSTFLLFWPEEDRRPKPYRVCLDAGHDAGNMVNKSPDGSYYEHEFALDMSKRLKTLLERAGLDVIETRPDGRAVSLSRRCQIANEAHADLFVSLHSNAAPTHGWSSPRGLEVHIYSKGGKAERCAKAVVDRMRGAGIVLRPYPVVEKNLQVLRGTKMAAILVEHGFHTNQADTALLKTSPYRALLALSDAEGILDYLGVPVPADWPQEPPEEPLDDPEPTEVEMAIQWVQDEEIMLGNEHGDLMLDQPVTRRQLAVMLYRALVK